MKSKIIIKSELAELFEYSQIYCSASCCEEKAFEISHILIRRKIIDKNLSNCDGSKFCNEAWKQLRALIYLCSNQEIFMADEKMIPIFYESDLDLPEFHLHFDKFISWLSLWDNEFKIAAGHDNPFDYSSKSNTYDPSN